MDSIGAASGSLAAALPAAFTFNFYKFLIEKTMLKQFFAPLLIALAFHATATAQSPGSLIPTFGDNGKVITENGNYLCAQRTVVDNAGKVLVLARINLNPYNLALSRYLPNGDLDATFGANGTVVTTVKAGLLVDLDLQPDGKILVTGTEETFPAGLLVARYLSNGTLDPTFGNQGLFKSTVNASRGNALTLTTDEKIVVAGTLFNSANQGTDIFLTRLQTNGAVDATFGNNGSITHDFGGAESVFEVKIQADHKIVVFGKSTALPTYTVFRFLANGTLDNTFGNNGRVVLSQIAPVTWGDLHLQNDGKMVLGGTADDGSGGYQLWAARLLSGGSLDATFGQNGVAKTSFNGQIKGEALLVDQQGRYLVGGDYLAGGQTTQMALTRFTADGGVDTDFGTNGLAIVEFGTGYSEACTDLTQLSNGNIIAVGCALSFPNAKTLIAGLYPDLTSDVQQPGAAPALQLTYYPNPTQDWLYYTGNLSADTRVALTDSAGKLVTPWGNNQGKISTANLPTGHYFLVLRTAAGQYAYPVVVQR
jgi:uncharacterized delta-60 repeat protein